MSWGAGDGGLAADAIGNVYLADAWSLYIL